MVTVSHIPGLHGISSLNQLHTQVFSKLTKKLDPPEKIVVCSTFMPCYYVMHDVLDTIMCEIVTLFLRCGH